MTKEERIKKEVDKLKRIFKDMTKDRKDTVNSLINNASFMAITLEDLQVSINTDGTMIEYKNGENQFGTKESPDVNIYNKMIKNYMSIIKQLTDLLPKETAEPKNDEFDSFVASKG